jgi:hypothetical protein
MRRRDLLTGAAAMAAHSALADGIYNAGAPNVSGALDGIGLPVGAGGYRLWKPTDLASLVSWLDPNILGSVTLKGSNISAIADQTGNYNASGTVRAQPAYAPTGINGKPAIQFSANTTLSSGLQIGVVPRAITMLFNNSASGTNRALLAGNGPGSIEMRLNTTNGLDVLQQNINLLFSSAAALPIGLNILVFCYDGTSYTLRTNGAYTDVGAGAAASFTVRSATIGSSNGTENFDSYLGPFLATSAMLSENEMEKVEGYIAWEYGLQSSLPATHAYKAAPPTVAPLDTSYKFATNRTRQSQNFLTSDASSCYVAAQQVYHTPDYPQNNFRFCIPNFYTPQTSVAPFEVDCGAGRRIEGASVKIESTYYPLTFGGQSSHTFAACEGYVWTDPLPGVTIPANSSFTYIQAEYTPPGQNRPVGFNPIVGLYGDSGTQASTTQVGFCSGGSMGTPTFGLLSPCPIAIVAKGAPAGRPAVLVIGDSIGDGANVNPANQLGARANGGYIPHGLDDNTPGFGIFAHGQFSVGATNFDSITPTQFAFRRQLLKDVGFPFTTILCEHFNNNVGGGLSNFEGPAEAAWVYLKTMGRKKLIQTFCNPLTADASNDLWTTTTNQTTAAANTYLTGERWGMVAYIKTLPPNVDAYIDVTPYWVSGNDKWAPVGRNSVLTNSVSAGLFITVTGTPPVVGDNIVIGAGAAGAVARNVGSVAPSGSDWLVTFTMGEAAISTAFAAGAAVRAQPSSDGIHPSGPYHAAAAQGIINAKSAGMFA